MSDPNVAPPASAAADQGVPELALNGVTQHERRRSSQPLSEKTSTPHSVKTGWDGKLRVEKKAVIKNADAVEDSDQDVDSEDELPGEEIKADEDLLNDEDPETEEIDAQHSRISSIPSLRLERFPKLTRLGLRQNLIKSIDLPSTLAPNLVELELYDNLISHIRNLEAFTSLRSLDISYNKIRHIKHLDHLKDLTHLYLVQNKISKIDNLEGLEKLQYLELGANRIRKIEGLETLKGLTQLWLGQNKITSLQGLSTCQTLRTLSIQANRIESLEGLEKLPQLEELYISDNLVTSLAPLVHNPNLIILDVQNNPIETLDGVEGLKKLENLWASGCKLPQFEELTRVLKDKEKLSEVYFEGNPLQKQNEVLYRNKVRLALPQVTKIDASYVRA
ncbi:Protein phosphatase 1 regulatory subunit SDS22 [Sphaceloma murrayae]|uniref:Protein phosphatase 1 regulatory subunit SDS22 n=1 Tax=Sphaceloma murrayae TaxID=2082308 RepID=A0A2K1QTM0_9PEZI|nr:Protein phosphatase 1 regulatory subunit SDS22 [Sphaceloma murrayae]